MLKLNTSIPFGDDQLDTAAPVKGEWDLRNRTITLRFGLAIEDAKGICVASTEQTADGQTVSEFPVIDKSITVQDPQGTDPAIGAAFSALEQALESFLMLFYTKAKADEAIQQQTFRVGRTAYPLVFNWVDYDTKKHGSYVELKAAKIDDGKKEKETV